MRILNPTHALIIAVLAIGAACSGCQQTPLPPLKVESWINGDSETESKLKGKVVVLDFFATWCGPCRESTPELMELYLKYREQGVEFIGLTYEDSSDLDLIQKYVDDLGIAWPVGYGADKPTDALQVEALPTVVIFDSQGHLVLKQVGYDPNSETIEKTIQAALAAKK